MRDNGQRGVSQKIINMDEKKELKNAWWQKGLQLFLRLSSWIVFPVIAAVVIGKWLDRVFGTAPWLMFCAIAISFIVSMVMIIRIGLREMDSENPKSK